MIVSSIVGAGRHEKSNGGMRKGLCSVYAREGRNRWNPLRQPSQVGLRGGPVLRQEYEEGARDTPEHSRSAASAREQERCEAGDGKQLWCRRGTRPLPRDAKASDQATSTSNVRRVDFADCARATRLDQIDLEAGHLSYRWLWARATTDIALTGVAVRVLSGELLPRIDHFAEYD
jgi:hypothetical protein